MTRITVILFALLVACNVGDATVGNNPGGGPDAGSATGGDGGGSNVGPNGCYNSNPTPALAWAHTAPVNPADPYNMGQNCMQANCHGIPQGVGAPAYLFGGTLYTDITATTPVAGAAIAVKGMDGTVTKTYTDDHGNFYLADTGTPLSFPATTNASSCPSILPMATPLVQGNGQCNTCHNATQPTNGAAGVVYLTPPST